MLGAPRSGTTLMYGMLLRGQQTLGGIRMESFLYNRSHTLPYTEKTIENWQYLRTLLEETGQNPAEMLQKHQDFFEIYADAANTFLDQREFAYFVEKSPIHTAWYREIARDYPDSKWVIISRHPLANVHSIAKTRSRWFSLGVDKLPFGLGEKPFFRYLNATVRFYFYWQVIRKARKFPNAVVDVYYEDVVADPEEFRKLLEEKLGVEMNPLQPIRPSASSVDSDDSRKFHTRNIEGYKEKMPGWAQFVCRAVFIPKSAGEHLSGVFLKLFLIWPGYLSKLLINSVRKSRS